MFSLENCPNVKAFEAFFKCERHILLHSNIMVSISGGADSDVMLDLIVRVAKDENISLDKFHFVFFNTGIEYSATLEHLDFLEKKYGIKIERYRAITPVPVGCKKFGQPFLSKAVSENIDRLQKHNFKWEDKPCLDLLQEYCEEISEESAFDKNGKLKKGISKKIYGKYWKGCVASILWWCNEKEQKTNGSTSSFNINYNSYLKEFIIANPPTFKISQKCCQGAKKDNAHKLLDELNADLNVVGVRKAEGGVRATAYKSCFDEGDYKHSYDNYRPIFWFSDQDKIEYCAFYGIEHSDCYTKYGLKRTGCVGCPFGKDFEKELETAKQFEPKLYNAVCNIFKESYEYTRAYYEFKKQQKNKGKPQQLNLFE